MTSPLELEDKTLTALRAVRSATPSAARRCASDYLPKLCNEIQLAADLGNIMYNGIKGDLGPSEKNTIPLKTKYGEPITDLKEQIDI